MCHGKEPGGDALRPAIFVLWNISRSHGASNAVHVVQFCREAQQERHKSEEGRTCFFIAAHCLTHLSGSPILLLVTSQFIVVAGSRTSRTMTMFGNKKKRAPRSDSSSTEVEISLDSIDKLFSIVVTEAQSLQSIVSVPTVDGEENRDDPVALKRSGSRLADTLRPTSPLPRSRRSALEDRGRVRSCPPSSTRRCQAYSTSPRNRDTSCPPKVKDISSRPPRFSLPATRTTKKPNLVSRAAARTGKLFPRERNTRKIIPAL